MGVIITPKSEVDAYFASEAKGQSDLKGFLGGLESYKSKQDKKESDSENEVENISFTTGKAVDVILTGAPGQFEEEFYCSRLTKFPSDIERLMTQHVFVSLLEDEFNIDEMMDLSDRQEYVQAAITCYNWYKGKPGEKRTSGFMENCNEYFNDLKNSHGKKVLDISTKKLVDEIVMSLSTNERTKKFFDRESLERNTVVDVYYQLPIYFEHKGVECKALLDLVIVVRNESGAITHVIPYDLKTMQGDTIKFPWSVKKFRYDIQGAWYSLALTKWLDSQDKHSDCVLEAYQFIVESTTRQGKPLVYQLSEEVLSIGREGRPAVTTASGVTLAHEIKGYEQLLDEYKWYEQHGWELDREVVLANDEPLLIGWDGIKQ